MRVSALNGVDLTPYLGYLQATGLDTYFTPTAVDNNSSTRATNSVSDYTPEQLQDILNQLDISENKFFIIRLLQRQDVISILPYLQPSQLINGMNFFQRDDLLLFMNYLPKEQVMQMLLSVIPLRTLMQLFPTEIIFNILRSQRLNVTDMASGFKNMPLQMLQQLMMNITGQNTEQLSQRELCSMFRQLDKVMILNGMKQLGDKHIFEYTFQSVQKDPQLLTMIPQESFMNVMSSFPKANLLDLFQMVDPSILMQFLTQLPDPQLALTAAQIDDNTFSYLMLNKFSNVLASLATAA